MADRPALLLNGETVEFTSPPDTPLLYVLTDELALRGPRFGCGLAQCGSCSVLVDGVEIRSCVTPVSAVAGKSITTLEGLPARYATRLSLDRVPSMTPLQRAMLDTQAPQCGYCYNGILIKATELLEANPDPDEADIRSALDGHLCRCGTYPGIIAAILLAAATMRETA